MGSTSIDEEILKFMPHTEENTVHLTSFDLDAHVFTESFLEVLSAFVKLAEFRLSKKQKQLLLVADEFLRCENMTLNSLIEEISRELKMPSSTVKWNINVLKKVGLIEGGRKDNKGLPARLTQGGKILAEYLRKTSLM